MTKMLLLAQGSATLDNFFGLEADERFVILVIAIGCGTAIVISLAGIIAGVVSSLHRRNAEYDLKREMLDRGMSSEEIAQVIESAPQPEDGVDRWIASWSCGKKKNKS